MTKEELIQKLQALSDILPQEQIDLDIMSVEANKREIDDKIADLENYRNAEAAASNRAEHTVRKNALDNAKKQLKNANNNLTNLNNNLSSAQQRQVTITREEIRVQDKLNQAILNAQRKIQTSTNLDKAELDRINASIEANQALIDASKAKMQAALDEVTKIQSQITAQQGVIASAQNAVNVSQERVDAFKGLVTAAENTTKFVGNKYDQADRMNDMAISENLQNSLDNMANGIYSRINLRNRIESLIEGLNNDTITFEQAQQALREYSENNITKEILNDSAQQRYAAIRETDVAIAGAKVDIEELERKLADDDNYRNNMVVTSNMNKIQRAQLGLDLHKDEANTIKVDIEEIDSKINSHNDEITSFRATIDALTAMNASHEVSINNVEQLSVSDANKASQKATYQALILANKKEIERIEAEINDRNSKITDLQNAKSAKLAELQNEQSFVERYNKVIDGLKTSYNYDATTNTVDDIDMMVKQADERRLQQLKASLVSLENYKATLSYNMKEQLDEIINAQPTASMTQTPAPTPTPAPAPVGGNEPNPNNGTVAPTVPDNGTKKQGVKGIRQASSDLVKKGKGLLSKIKDKLSAAKKNSGLNKLWYALVTGALVASIFGGVKLADKLNGQEKNVEPETNIEQMQENKEEDIEEALDTALQNTMEAEKSFVNQELEGGFTSFNNAGDEYIVEASNIKADEPNPYAQFDAMSDEEVARYILRVGVNGRQARIDLVGENNYPRAQRWIDNYYAQKAQQAAQNTNTNGNPTQPGAQVGDTETVYHPAPGIISQTSTVVAVTEQGEIPTSVGEVHEDQHPDTSLVEGEHISGGELMGESSTPVGEGESHATETPENGNENTGLTGDNGATTTYTDENGYTVTETITGGQPIGGPTETIVSDTGDNNGNNNGGQTGDNGSKPSEENDNIITLYPGDSYEALDGTIITNNTNEPMQLDITKYLGGQAKSDVTDITALAEQWQANMGRQIV